MRKLLALVLVLVLVVSFATVVFAETNKTGESTKVASPGATTETSPDKPKDPESPKTGDFILLLIPIVVLGLFGVVVSTKKLVKNH